MDSFAPPKTVQELSCMEFFALSSISLHAYYKNKNVFFGQEIPVFTCVLS